MGTAAKVALGVILGGLALMGGCVIACGLLVGLGQKTRQEDERACFDLVDVKPTRGYNERAYAHIAGVAENRSAGRTVSYLEVGVELLRGPEIVASGFTNETDLRAGEKRPFSTMIQTSGLGPWSTYRLSVRECRLAPATLSR